MLPPPGQTRPSSPHRSPGLFFALLPPFPDSRPSPAIAPPGLGELQTHARDAQLRLGPLRLARAAAPEKPKSPSRCHHPPRRSGGGRAWARGWLPGTPRPGAVRRRGADAGSAARRRGEPWAAGLRTGARRAEQRARRAARTRARSCPRAAPRGRRRPARPRLALAEPAAAERGRAGRGRGAARAPAARGSAGALRRGRSGQEAAAEPRASARSTNLLEAAAPPPPKPAPGTEVVAPRPPPLPALLRQPLPPAGLAHVLAGGRSPSTVRPPARRRSRRAAGRRAESLLRGQPRSWETRLLSRGGGWRGRERAPQR